MGFVFGITLVAEIVAGGISVGTSSPPQVTGTPGTRPPCGSVMGSFGWLVAFWVRSSQLEQAYTELPYTDVRWLDYSIILWCPCIFVRPCVFLIYPTSKLFDPSYRLTAWKSYEFWKNEFNTPLFKIIWRDGLLYFFVIFSMKLINVILFLTDPKGLRGIASAWVFTLSGAEFELTSA